MIQNTIVLEDVRQEWGGVEALQSKLKRSAFASGIGGRFPFALADAAHNLPFIHACAILNNVLEQLRDEGRFPCGERTLGALVNASKDEISWLDYALIKDKIVKDRNDIAHHGKLLGRGKCWEHIDAVKAELSGWGIL